MNTGRVEGVVKFLEPFFRPKVEQQSQWCVLVIAQQEKRPIFPQSGPNACHSFTEAMQNVFVEFAIDRTSRGHKFFVHNPLGIKKK